MNSHSYIICIYIHITDVNICNMILQICNIINSLITVMNMFIIANINLVINEYNTNH